MHMDRLLDVVRSFDGVLELAPVPGSEFPQIAWGDHFFYFSPDGLIPERVQPYATVVTKNYPDDTSSDLDPPDRWRLNIHVGRSVLAELVGGGSESDAAPIDFGNSDTVLPHPVYRAQGWICIVNPGVRTTDLTLGLLRRAHEDARRRAFVATERRLDRRSEQGRRS